MKHYNLTVVLHANVAVNATRGVVETLVGASQLVVIGTEATDIDWNEIDVSAKD